MQRDFKMKAEESSLLEVCMVAARFPYARSVHRLIPNARKAFICTRTCFPIWLLLFLSLSYRLSLSLTPPPSNPLPILPQPLSSARFTCLSSEWGRNVFAQWLAFGCLVRQQACILGRKGIVWGSDCPPLMEKAFVLSYFSLCASLTALPVGK